MPTLTSIHVYPIKSCAGLPVEAWDVDEIGLQHDRRWMIVTPGGQFLTQREFPALALVQPHIVPPHLHVSAPGMPDLITPLGPMGGRPVATGVWDDPLQVIAPDHAADEWFSRYLGYEVVLVHFPPQVVRQVDRRYAPDGGRAAFADGFPLLLVGEASLAELNRRLTAPLPMNRFRPNLVVAGAPPFAEDTWGRIRVGGIPMQVVKPCARCVVTTTDQATGQRAGDEPLRTLATFRRQDGGVIFGQNVVHYGTGPLRTGMIVEIEAA
jgi:MOSC domain-containing protein